MVALKFKGILGSLINAVAVCQEVRIHLKHADYWAVFQYLAL
jgi:hypothetical protein